MTERSGQREAVVDRANPGLARRPQAADRWGGRHGALLALHWTAGNQAVTHLLRHVGGGTCEPHQLGVHLQRSAPNSEVVRFLGASPAIAPEDDTAEVEATNAEHDGAPVARPAGVRVHTDPAAASVADSLGAEAVTWDRNVFFGSGQYAPGTPAGDRLLRHEFTHATRHSPARAHLKPVTNRLDFLVVKKIPIGVHRTYMAALLDTVNATAAANRVRPPRGQQDGGHWWVEVGMRGRTGTWLPIESYGWWPVDLGRGAAKPMYAWEVLKLKRIPGQLNQGQGKDPHHGNAARAYHPAVTFDDTLSYERLRQDYEDRVRGFAAGFSGSWNWRWNWGKNCHTFVERLERAIGARCDDSKPLVTDPRNGDAMVAAITIRDEPRQTMVTKFATLRGLGAADLLADLGRLKMMGTVTEGDLKAVNHDDEVREQIVQLIGAPVNVISNAVGALWPGWGKLFS